MVEKGGRGMNGSKPPGKPGSPARRNTAETILWLLVILGLLVLVLQGTGYLPWFQLQGTAAVIGLSVIGVALVSGAVYSYLQSVKLKQTIKRLTEQQRKRFRSVTINSEDDSEETRVEREEEQLRHEQLRFTAITEERQRLARELHDAVSQQLFAISMTATAVGRTLEKDFDRARRQVELIEEMASVAQSEMRALLLHLRPVHLEGKNLGQALEGLMEELRQKVPMKITLEMDPIVQLIPHAEDHLFRIIQEALSNTLRHSKANEFNIRIERHGNQLRLTMRDDGVGFDMEEKKQTSYGLLTMEERVMELGGTMHVITAPGQGTGIEIWIPIIAEEGGGE